MGFICLPLDGDCTSAAPWIDQQLPGSSSQVHKGVVSCVPARRSERASMCRCEVWFAVIHIRSFVHIGSYVYVCQLCVI